MEQLLRDVLLNQIDFSNELPFVCVFPPYPRKMGISISPKIQQISKELESIEFTSSSTDSPFVVALQTAINLGVNEIFLIGFDGYNTGLNNNQFVLAQENQNIINDILKNTNICIKSLSPTKYENIQITSIYSLI